MSAPQPIRQSPYQGLIPYSEGDAAFFFGREKETRLITANLFASPLTLLYGASGVGKSSVLRAGVGHQLRQRDDLLIVIFNSWQLSPVPGLIQEVADQAQLVDHDAWVRIVDSMPGDSEISLFDFLKISAHELNRRVMIILDQFEEYFLYHPHDEEFVLEFSKAVTNRDVPLSFLISIREDFYARLDRFEGRIAGLYDNYLRIEHLDREAAQTAIEKPIAEYNRRVAAEAEVKIELELIDEVLKQVRTGEVIFEETGHGAIEISVPDEQTKIQIETPFLQLVMTRLWKEDASTRTLRLTTFIRLGGAASIVRMHLDQVMLDLTPSQQDTAATVFRYLVTPSGTKISYNASDLAATAEVDPAPVEEVLKKLAHGEVRVLRPVDPSPTRPDEPRYEIFHDVLAPAILDWRARHIRTKLLLKSLHQSLNSLSAPDQEIAARILSSLITSFGTRRLGLIKNLADEASLPMEQVTAIVDRLSSMAIMKSEVKQGRVWFELSHDLLIAPVQNWLKSHRSISIRYLGPWGITFLSVYLFGLILLLVFALVAFWPPIGVTAGSSLAEPVRFLFWRFSVSDDVRLLFISALAGALGPAINNLRSLYWYVVNRVQAITTILRFVSLPFVGAALALLGFFSLLGGLLNMSTTAEAFNPFGVAAVGALLGLFSAPTTDKLRTIFETLFSKSADVNRASRLDPGSS